MSDKNISMLQPDYQIDSLNNFKDDIVDAQMQYGENVGISQFGHSNGFVQVGSLDVFRDTTNSPFTVSNEGKFIIVEGSTNGNDGAYQITTYNAANNVTVTPALNAVETGLVYRVHNFPNMEDLINYQITQLANILGNYPGSKDWKNNLPRGFDAANTDGSDTKNEKIDLTVLAANWYGSKTKMLRNLVFSAQSISTTDVGKLLTSSVKYATPTNRTDGINGAFPIFKSVINVGDYYDEDGINAICKVNIIEEATGNEFFDINGNIIFGKLYDGADYHPSGFGDGVSVFVKFFKDDGSNGGKGAEYTWTANDPTTVRFELPRRKRRKDINEYEESQLFTGSTLGDAETSLDISRIRQALGLGPTDEDGDWDWTNVTANYPLQSDPATAEGAINALNNAIGNRVYTAENYINNGESITLSLDALDQAINGAGTKSKIIERVSSPIVGFTNHVIPFATGSNPLITTYKLDTGNRGLYLSIYVNGKKLIPHINWAARGEYEEINNTTVRFRFTIGIGDTIEYLVHDDA
jgi:hypothetical protein